MGRLALEACAVCGSSALKPHWNTHGTVGEDGFIPTTKEFGRALGNVVQCRSCGHMQLDRMPTDEELQEAYGEAASTDYVAEERGQRISARRVLERIEQHVARGPLVDLGCWVGFLVAEAVERGWDAIGVEPSAFASTYARERLDIDVRTEDMFTVQLPKSHFHAVVLGDVIEHLPSPARGLKRVRELLAFNGVLALMAPDAGSAVARALGSRWWSVIPTHVHYFTRRSIASLLTREGFEVLHIGSDPKSFTVRYYLDKTGGYSVTPARAAVALAERLKVADRMWTPDFRDRMLVIARRPVGS